MQLVQLVQDDRELHVLHVLHRHPRRKRGIWQAGRAFDLPRVAALYRQSQRLTPCTFRTVVLAMKIFIAAGETTLGPYTVDEVRESLREGTIQPDGLGCIEGASEWLPLSEILKAIAARPMPGVIEKPPHPIPKKPPTSQKPNIPPKRTIPQQFTSEIEHLWAIRQRTCYPALRAVINFVTILLLAGWSVLIIMIAIGVNLHGGDREIPPVNRLIMLIVPFFGIVLSIAFQQASSLLADIADTLIFDSNHTQRE